MAAKSRHVTRLESEIDKFRGDGNWAKVLDLAKQLPSKSSHLETLAKFVQVESELERYLLENPPSEKNASKAQTEMVDIQRKLQEVLSSEPQQDIILLQGKIAYAMADYQDALAKYTDVGLDNLNVENVPLRKVKIIGEAYAIKGLSLEKQPASSTSRFKQQEREEQIIACFERSGDISLFQLQERQQKSKNQGTSAVALQSGGTWNVVDSDSTGVGPMVETAIQRSPILYIRNGELSKGIGRFRELLRAVETRATQGLRQTLARQLAEVLLRGVDESTYVPMNNMTNGTESPTMVRQLKPRLYSGSPDKLYVPSDRNEEALLLLLISESIANREAVLNRSHDLNDVRLHTFHNTTAVCDLLTIALVRRAQFDMLSETFERAMKFSFDEFHIWYQFALSLICANQVCRAFLVLKECLRLQPTNAVILLLAAKLCYENLHLYSEGIEFSQQVIESVGDGPMLARGYLTLGIGHSLQIDECRLQSERQTCQRKALNALIKSVELDKNDYLALYHLAMQYALLRQIPEALKHTRAALSLRSDHLHSLHLLALLLSAQKQPQKALELIETSALAEHPENFALLMTKCRLEEVVFGAEYAIQSCHAMLELWKKKFCDSFEMDEGLERIPTEHRNFMQLQLAEQSDRESVSIRGETIAASRIEHALSEVASSLNSSVQAKPGPLVMWQRQVQIWLRLTELYLRLGKLDCAQNSIQEATSIHPISHALSHMRGRLYEEKEELAEAKACYENAVAINPCHVISLQHLGMVLHKMGNGRMAEKVLRDAVNIDPMSSVSWFTLGRVLETLEDFEASVECLTASVGLEATTPIVPFSELPKMMP
ncbi:hypothetical protein CAPTEDRAFT_175698 [Capitella teleta]|uniref:Tetratricopeptide repeat protein 7 N-terminal domain-containing protein n=1 Tax=Capitella teleta TaxID=283909 RepID=R7TC78_CAPTE|nr:hypothetical protein CAPTEDRAFT_175698 [Capitella teleta]|eukprot:ELT88701.1 hypothetical protein CAPTEDRAFT_175698 [Capitella teleta]